MSAQETYTDWRKEAVGWLLLAAVLLFLVRSVPGLAGAEVSYHFFFLLGLLGVWRYGMALLHVVRGLIFLYVVFPRHRRQVEALGEAAHPDQLFALITSFRIDTETTINVYRSAMQEAKRCPYPVTIVASLVEYADEGLVRQIWRSEGMPERCTLKIVRVKGTGKRDGLAYGFRSIARENPGPDSVVAVVDGDTVVTPGTFEKCAPFFALFPDIGGLTTDEFCEPNFASYALREFHRSRFAQRQISMASMALSKRVLTMTGRLSLFRATAVCHPEFIGMVENDELTHWRLGRFKFLTGDDKSTWFSLARRNWGTYYVPDIRVITMEYAPHPNFFAATRMLMFRWSGNSLRQNLRATGLGPGRLGWFTYLTLWDQRAAIWTTLFGPTVALLASLRYSIVYLLVYLTWVLITRTLKTWLMAAGGHRVGPAWPIMIFYTQVVGSVIKIGVLFNLNKQSWTRQKTRLATGERDWRMAFRARSSSIVLAASILIYVALLLPLV